MRDISEDMQNAAGDLRRRDPGQASASGSRALEKLRDLEKEIQASGPDERRRALGDIELEARQVADAERQVASELSKLGQRDGTKETTRRLAGDQERLAERVQLLQERLKQQAASAALDRSKDADQNVLTAVREAWRDVEQQRLSERMKESAGEMRTAAGTAEPDNDGKRGAPTPERSGDPLAQAARPLEMARALDKLADRLGAVRGPKDSESRKLSDELARAQDLRAKLDDLSRALEKAGRQNDRAADESSTQKSPGDRGRSGEGRRGTGGSEVARLRKESLRRLQETQALLDQLKREDPTFSRSGAGFTFEGQGMTLSAPGTEAFKQDFAKWDALKRQATTALERVESTISKKLQAKASKDRLAAGVDDHAPPEYQKQVDSYYKALATKKKR